MGKTILGIDEAGKGPVVGPLVIAGALFESKSSKELKKMGVKDSKLLTSKQREVLFPDIQKIAVSHKVIKVSPQEIDQRFSVNTNLNQLEAIKFAELINDLKPDIAIIDCPSKNTKSFADYMKKFMTHKCTLKCENFADKNHFEVGAASILAKVIRDRDIHEIEKEVGMNIGLGYPSDPVTIDFVEKALKNKDWQSKYIRKTWYTVQRLKEEKEQTNLSSY